MSKYPRFQFTAEQKGDFDRAFTARSVESSLCGKPGTDHFRVKPLTTSTSSHYDWGILSDRAAPAVDKKWKEVSSQYENAEDPHPDFSERISDDEIGHMSWDASKKFVNALGKAVRQELKWIDYHSTQADQSRRKAELEGAWLTHTISGVRHGKFLMELGQEATAIASHARGELASQEDARVVATDILGLQTKIFGVWGIDASITQSRNEAANVRPGSVYQCWLGTARDAYTKKTSLHRNNASLLSKQSEVTRSDGLSMREAARSIDHRLIDDLTNYMRKVPPPAPSSLSARDEPPAAIISYAQTGTGASAASIPISREQARSGRSVKSKVAQGPRRKVHRPDYHDTVPTSAPEVSASPTPLQAERRKWADWASDEYVQSHKNQKVPGTPQAGSVWYTGRAHGRTSSLEPSGRKIAVARRLLDAEPGSRECVALWGELADA